MVAPYTKERPVPFFGACAKNYFLFASPSSTNSFSSLLSFSVAKEGCVEVGLKESTSRDCSWEEKGATCSFPSSFLLHRSCSSSSIIYGKRTCEAFRGSNALGFENAPLCVSFQTSGGDRFLVLLLLACQQGLMAPFTPFLH